MIEIVNGYICMNCCDVDKARMGQDPHQSANQIQKQLEQIEKSGPTALDPAVKYGGSLGPGTNGGGQSATGTAQDSQSLNQRPIPAGVNLLV
jgi:hypothetical protein